MKPSFLFPTSPFVLRTLYFVLGSSVAAATLEPYSRIEFDAVIPNGQSITLSLGRGRESLWITAQDNAYRWNYTGTKGETPKNRPYPGSSRPAQREIFWWWNNTYTPNGHYKRSFSMPPAIAAASEAMLAERWQTADKRTLHLAVEHSDGWLSFFVDDVLLHALPATVDVADCELKVTKGKNVTLGELQVAPVEPTPGFWRVPLGRVATLSGNPLASEPGASAAPGAPLWPNSVRPSPLEAPAPFLASSNAVEVGRSWTREASMREAGSPSGGTFGGRWTGALSATPCRLQFRVPNRPYNAMYLLASCTTNNFLSVVFYRPGSGFPVDFAPAEPIATDGNLQVIRVPLRQDLLAAFADLEVLEFELTGHVENYRAHPEPLNYSRHGMGLPSGVTVHAITLEEAPLAIDFEPEEFGNIWVGNNTAAAAYLLTLRNRTIKDTLAQISVETRSADGTDVSEQKRALTVPARGEAKIRLATPVHKFGWHSVSLKVNGEPYERTLAMLRVRDHRARAFEEPGMFFGGWLWGGAHLTPPTYDSMRLAAKLGLDSFSHGNAVQRADVATLARGNGLRDYTLLNGFGTGRLKNYDEAYLEESMRNAANHESALCDPTFQICFAEPGGIGREASIVAL